MNKKNSAKTNQYVFQRSRISSNCSNDDYNERLYEPNDSNPKNKKRVSSRSVASSSRAADVLNIEITRDGGYANFKNFVESQGDKMWNDEHIQDAKYNMVVEIDHGQRQRDEEEQCYGQRGLNEAYGCQERGYSASGGIGYHQNSGMNRDHGH
ncbi:hypothetical protein WAI453_004960 [Rhynchosporium graminicola]